ncbi:MAG: DUF1330 domain-containing protein [Deltaproteobacteria bacterium]|nr:DUF1330 domain-containing protein [Deltaproteobacteria bacterium]
MPAYVLAELTIEDRAEYGRYEAAFMDVFKNFRGELLVVDEKPTVVEGTWPHTRTVLIRFPDAAEAERWYRSPEYQAIAQHRWRASRANAVILQGLA